MRSFVATITRGIVGLSLALSAAGVGTTAPVAAGNSSLDLPPYAQLVEGVGDQTWEQTAGSQLTGPVQLVVHINKAPLAMVGKYWTHQQRRDYVASIRAEQDKLVPQIEALGGQVVGRFAQLSTGLAVTIDASQVSALRGLANVIGVRGVANYQLDLTETVDWIGAGSLQDMGITGTHRPDLGGLGIDVAVIDSGVDYTHSKLGGTGSLADYAACYSDPADTSDCALFPNAKVAGGFDWVGEDWPVFSGAITPDGDPIDFEGHGTHVADIIGGFESAPGAGDQGVAPGVNIWAFKACSAVSSSCNGLALLLALDDAMDLDDSDYGVCDPTSDGNCTTYDPADVVNMSLGSPYGQPEDDLTHFANLASYYGSVVVVSAGNSGDRPYIVGSPSTADGAISVAQSTVPSDKVYNIRVGGVVKALGVLQPWSPAPAGPISGPLQYGNGAGGNLDGCAAFPAGSLTGKVLLVNRGTCNISAKMSNGAAAGAGLVIIANNAFSNTPPSFSFGGATAFAPTLTVTQNDGTVLKALVGQTTSTSDSDFVLLQDDIVASSGRGPRIADGDIKPDIAAPGASVSAEVGTGTDKTAFGGTSGAAPMVSGAAALIVQDLEMSGILRDGNPGVALPGISAAPLVKALLMNNAMPNTTVGGTYLAPITLQGAGRVDVLSAYEAGTMALDVTDLYNWIITGQDAPCTVSTSPTNFIQESIFGAASPWYNGSYNCLSAYPFGNDFFNSWNSVTGSLSFGFDGVSGSQSETRKVLIVNLGGAARTYNLSTAFRYTGNGHDADNAKGVSISASPSVVTVPGWPGDGINLPMTLVDVTVQVNAKGLRDWTLDAGMYGASGTNIYCSNPNPQNGCPTLTMYEYDGFVTINGGADNVVRLPWQILPKKAARTEVTKVTSSSVKLRNAAKYKPGDTDVLALVDVSVNNCEIVDTQGNCVEENYVPGILPGINATAIDLKEVGLRSYQVPGLNPAIGLPQPGGNAITDEVIDFGLTVYDKPFRASHNYPVEFDIYIDSNADGVDDYVVFNADQTLNASDGRNAVFVADVNPADGTRATRPYFYSFTDFNSQNWILPVPAAAIGVKSTQPFKFLVLAFDSYFTGDLWDCSPGNCADYHQFQTGKPKYQPVVMAFQVAPKGAYTLQYSTPAGGASASPSQIGLLFMYRDAPVEAESEHVTLP